MAQNVRKGEELHEGRLKTYLFENQLIRSIDSEINISQFSTGFSNLTYLLNIEEKDLVLRRPPNGAIKRGHDMGREYKVLSGLNKGFTKAPIAHCFTEDIEILGTPFYIMERVNGIILSVDEVSKRNIPTHEYDTIANELLDTLVELHNLDYKALGLEDLGKPDGYVERQVRNWGKQYLKAATDDIPEAEKVMKWLDENQPKEYNSSLIHNDYKYDNVVFADDSWKNINAILDWEMCTLGDPLMDFGMSLAYWSTADDHPMIKEGLKSPTTQPGNPKRSEVVQMYAEKSGRSVNHLTFYYSFGLFKLAVIVQQIYYRYHNGYTSNEKFAHLNHATRLLITLAWTAIQKDRVENLF